MWETIFSQHKLQMVISLQNKGFEVLNMAPAFIISIIHGHSITRRCNTMENIGPKYLKPFFLISGQGKLVVKNLSINFSHGGWFNGGMYCLGIRKPTEIKLSSTYILNTPSRHLLKGAFGSLG